MIIRIINKIKEHMCKHLNEFRENTTAEWNKKDIAGYKRGL
jgi:hypothetical protein